MWTRKLDFVEVVELLSSDNNNIDSTTAVKQFRCIQFFLSFLL